MTWAVRVADEAAKQLKAIPPDRRKRIMRDLRELAQDPFRGLVKPLKGVEVLLILLRNESTYK